MTWLADGVEHCTHGPAIQEWSAPGYPEFEAWKFNGVYHRPLGQGPAVIRTNKLGIATLNEWHYKGTLHREIGEPAIIRRHSITAEIVERRYFFEGSEYSPLDLSRNSDFLDLTP